MSNDMIDRLLAEAETELAKTANDENGAPDNVSQQEQGGGDILTTAQTLLQKIEQFKVALGQNAAGQGGGDPNTAAPADPNAPQVDPNAPVVDPNAPQVQDPNAQVAAPAPVANNPIVITRPDGTQIKLASLTKLASVRGAALFSEVK